MISLSKVLYTIIDIMGSIGARCSTEEADVATIAPPPPQMPRAEHPVGTGNLDANRAVARGLPSGG